MKNILSSSLFLTLMLINYSCAQDLKPLDEEPDNSILKTEINYEMELVFEDENIIWGIEFLSDNSILASIKSGSLIHFIMFMLALNRYEQEEKDTEETNS